MGVGEIQPPLTMSPSNLLVEERPLSVGGMAVFPYDKFLEARMMVATRYSDPFNLSRRKGDLLYIPRELALMAGVAKNDLRTSGSPVKYAANCTSPPRNAEQARVLSESLALLKQGKSHIIKASTGFGKTWLGARLAYLMGLKTLVVVTKEDLLGEKQWLGAIHKFAGVPYDQIGLIRQNKCEVEDKTVVLAMVHSLAKEKYPEWIYDEFGLVIFDEVHRMAADTFSIAAGLFNAKHRLGLSAGSSGKKAMRVDSKDFVFEAHIGKVMVTAEFIPMRPKILVLESPWKVPLVPRRINGSWATVPLPHEPGKLGHVIVSLAKCQPRNALITSLILKSYKAGRNIVVFSELARDKHLDLLFKMAVDAGIPEKEMGFYVGGMKEKDREETKTKRVVFATYGMTSEATDVPWWDTAVLCTPRSNVKQTIGRVLREYPGKKQPVIFDIVDYDSTVLRRYFESRKKLYRTAEIKAEVLPVHLTKH